MPMTLQQIFNEGTVYRTEEGKYVLTVTNPVPDATHDFQRMKFFHETLRYGAPELYDLLGKNGLTVRETVRSITVNPDHSQTMELAFASHKLDLWIQNGNENEKTIALGIRASMKGFEKSKDLVVIKAPLKIEWNSAPA